MKKNDQKTDGTNGEAPDKESIVAELLAQFEALRAAHRGPFNKIFRAIDQAADDRPFEPPIIREPEAAPLVAALAESLEAVRRANAPVFNLLRARLKTALERIEAGRAISLNPPGGSHVGYKKYCADVLRRETLQPPDAIEAGKFYALNAIRAPHGDRSSGWLFYFADDLGFAFGHGRDPAGLQFDRPPGEKTEAENQRFRQHMAAAREALLADARSRRR